MTIDHGNADEDPRPEDAGRADDPVTAAQEHPAPEGHVTEGTETEGEPSPAPSAQPNAQPSAQPHAASSAGLDPATTDQSAWWVPVLTAAGVIAAGVVIFRRGGRVKAAAVMAAATPAAKAAQEVARQAAEKAERISKVIQEFAALDYAYQSAAMDQSVKGAFRRHQHWTPEELAVLADAGKTALEKALELGRTFYGVKEKSIQMGFSSKPPF